MNKVETNKSVLQHNVCEIGGFTGDIFEQLHLLILLVLTFSFQQK